MSLRSQRRIAASLLKAGETRVWIDPEEGDRVGSAITRQEIATLIREGRIRALPKKGSTAGWCRSPGGEPRGCRPRVRGCRILGSGLPCDLPVPLEPAGIHPPGVHLPGAAGFGVEPRR